MTDGKTIYQPAEELALEYPASDPGLLVFAECLREEKLARL